MADVLLIKNLSRSYGERKVLKDFSFSLESGKFVALMGASGSGKSTLLHLIAGLLNADEGEIIVDGEVVTKMRESALAKFRRSKIGVVFQSFNLLNELSVAENILMPLKLDSRHKSRDAKENLSRLATRLKIESLLAKKPEELSGGEQQRVAIARALIANPALVLADEPTGNLDATSARDVCQLLRELNRENKVAMIVVTHDPTVAAVTDEVYFLRDGNIVAKSEGGVEVSRIANAYLEATK